MPSRVGLVFGYRAVCTFQGTAGGGAYLKARGFTVATFTRNAAGDYSLTVDEALDTTGAEHGFLGLGSNGAVGTTMDVAIVSATVIRVRTGVASTLTDMIFTLAIVDIGPN